MAYIQYEELPVSVTTSTGLLGGADPTQVTYSAGTYNGLLHGIRFVTGSGGSSMTEDMVLAVTGERSGATALGVAVCTGTQTWYPRLITGTSAGAVMSTGAGIQFPLANERLVFTITSGSSAGPATGTFHIWVA